MKNHSEHLDDLIGKYLLGEATPAEMAEVDAWVQLAEENRHYFNQLKAIIQKSESARGAQSFNTDAAWEKVNARIKSAPESRREAKVIPMNRNRQFLRIAAAVVGVLFVSAFLFRLLNNPLQTLNLQAANSVVVDTLTGGTVVHLNKSSNLVAVYNPKEKSQRVQLTGEAFFEINKQKDEEFLIATQGIFIRDIGTSFNVKSTAGSAKVEVVVEEGEVKMYSSDNPGITILAGESGYYDTVKKSFSKSELLDRNVFAYKTKKFRFGNVRLGEVVQSLNAVYDKQIILQGDIGNCSLTISFNNEDIGSITDLIAETLGLKKSETNEGIVLEGSGCGQ